MAPEIKLRVGGKEYAGWKTARVMRGIESVSGSFALGVSERWGTQAQPWPIYEEDECTVLIGSETVITGWVDRRSPSYGAKDHALAVSGRDATGALVDCSAVLDQWEFRNVSVLAFARKVCEPFGIEVSLQTGLVLPPSPRKISVSPGDTAFNAIERACRLAGVLPVSDGEGGLLLTRAGDTHATTALVEGENILSASAEFDASGRFHDYFVLGQHRGSSEFFGASATTEIKAFAEDPNVSRVARSLLIRPEGNVTLKQAATRAHWEAATRAARADSVSVTVQGWTQGGGTLWPINVLVRVKSPAIGVNGDMLITQATYAVDASGGTTTELTLKPPDAFLPEAVALTVAATGLWKEIRHGV